MKTMTRRPVPDNNLIKSVRKLGPLCGLSGPALVIVLLFSWFLASCGSVSKQSQPLPPDFGLSTSPGTLTIAQGSNGSSTITVAPQNGFTGNVTLAASGLPNGVTASFSTNPTTPTSTVRTITLTDSSPTATANAAVSMPGTSGTLSHTPTLSLSLTAAAGTAVFTLSLHHALPIFAQGSNGSSTITVAPQNGFTGNVNLAASGLPNGVTASFSTNPTTPTSAMSTLTLTASSTAATGMSTVTITGTSGTLSHTTTLALTVNTTVSTLTVTPTTLSFNYQIGSAVPGAQSVSVTASPAALSFTRSEEHTSELQSHSDLVCRLLLEKKNSTIAFTQSRRPFPSFNNIY